MNPFIVNLEAAKPESSPIQTSVRILESENLRESEFAKILKSQIMEEPVHRKEAVEKDNQRNFLHEEPVQNEEFLENADDNRLYERLARLSGEAEKKSRKTEKRQTAETHETEILWSQKGIKPEINRLAEDSTAAKAKTNIEGQKTAADYTKKAFGNLAHEERHLNEANRFLETDTISKEGKNAVLKKIPEALKKNPDDGEKEFLTKPEKDNKLFTEKLKNQKFNTTDGEKAKSAAVAAKMSQEANEQPAAKITTDTINTPKMEISAEAKGGHAFQFSRDGQMSSNEAANKLPSAPQARPTYNFQEQLQSLLDNARIYVKDGKNGTFHVNLYPKSLGSVSMNLGLEHGVLNGRFLVENTDVKETLLQNFDSIRQQLEESGITVGEFHVNVRGEREKHNEELQKEVVNYRGFFSENEEITAVYEMNTTGYHEGSINMVI